MRSALATATQLAEGQWLEEQQNMVKFCIFQGGTQILTVSRTKGATFGATKNIYKKQILSATMPDIQFQQI